MVQEQQPRPPGPAPFSITISLNEIYDCLCPTCRERFLDLLTTKAGSGMLRETLRRQLEASRYSEQSEESPAHGEPVEP